MEGGHGTGYFRCGICFQHNNWDVEADTLSPEGIIKYQTFGYQSLVSDVLTVRSSSSKKRAKSTIECM